MHSLFLALAVAFGLDVHQYTAPLVTRVHFENTQYNTAADLIIFSDGSSVILADVPGYSREFNDFIVERHGTSVQFFDAEELSLPFLVVYPGGYTLNIKPSAK